MVYVFITDPAAIAGVVTLSVMDEATDGQPYESDPETDAELIPIIEEELRIGISKWEALKPANKQRAIIGRPSNVVALHNALEALKAQPFDFARVYAILVAEFRKP